MITLILQKLRKVRMSIPAMVLLALASYRTLTSGDSIQLVGVCAAIVPFFCLFKNFPEADKKVSAIVDVLLQHDVIIHLVNVIAGEDKQIFGIIAVDKVDILRNGICCSAEHFEAGVSFLAGSENEDTAVLCVKAPQAALCDIAVEQNGFVLGQNTHYINSAVGTVAEGEIDDAVFSTV